VALARLSERFLLAVARLAALALLLEARRLIERGLRIVLCYHGDVQLWDSHNDLAKAHRDLGTQIDGPLAALLTDLKQRACLKKPCHLGRRVWPHSGHQHPLRPE
jgi:hypothetical protein